MQQMALSALVATPSSSYSSTLSGLTARLSQRWHGRRVRSQVRAQAQAGMKYNKLGDSDLLVSEITLGTVCA
jgi:hypothetical protein